ncbi:MAG TPA: gephyrin-like molybdotransferase Glp [Glaciibacter sp.]|nr:gephyrin-like molybdotransferase Glp [Glaciibacter sp.]
MSGRLSVEDHQAAIRSLLPSAVPGPHETVSLRDALGRVSATAVSSPVDLPLFRNSQMDGFAVAAADLATLPVTLPVVGEIAARRGAPPNLERGTVVRIMTGAVVPQGADAVVPVEDTHVDGNRVTINRTMTAGEYVRNQGSDLHSGDLLIPATVRLAPRHLAALASAGIATVEVLPRLRIVVVTTGAELIEPGFPASLGEVYDSNGIALDAAARASGAEVTHVIRSDNDDPEALRASLAGVTHDADLIITSGGISMGNFEVVRDVLRSLDSWVGTVAMQPGGPQATGKFGGVPVISFPGNPVSSQVSFEVFLAPVLRELSGLPAARRYSLRMSGDVLSVAGKRQFLRGRRVAGDAVELVSGPGSHLVAGLAAADVLIDIPAETTAIADGDDVEVLEL